MNICKCGCGKEIIKKYSWRNPIYIRGHNRTNVILTEEVKKRMGESKKGKRYSQETELKKAELHPSWKGGRRSYYQDIARGEIETSLGRKIEEWEVVHHLDHNHKNNSIENLYVFPNQSEHMKYHQLKIRWIKDFLRGELV